MNYLNQLLNSPVFKEVAPEYIEVLLNQKNSITSLKKGEYLFHQGEIGELIYVILDGCLEIIIEYKGKKVILGTLSELVSLGEISVLTSRRRTASVKALSDVVLFCLEAKIFKKHIRQDNLNALKISYNILKIVAARLTTTNQIIFTSQPTNENELLSFRHKLAKELLL